MLCSLLWFRIPRNVILLQCCFRKAIFEHLAPVMMAANCNLDILSLKSHSIRPLNQWVSKPSHNALRISWLIFIHWQCSYNIHTEVTLIFWKRVCVFVTVYQSAGRLRRLSPVGRSHPPTPAASPPPCRCQTRSLTAGSTWPGWWPCCRKWRLPVLRWCRRSGSRRVWAPPSWRTWRSRPASRCTWSGRGGVTGYS